MANVRIKDLPQNAPIGSSWLPVEVMTTPGLFTTSKAHLSTVIGSASTSDIWTSTTRTVSSLSANWQNAYIQFNVNNYLRLRTCYNTVSALSADWTFAFANLNVNYWNEGTKNANNVYTVVRPGSANWNNSYTTLRANSGDWMNVETVVMNNSASWNNVYTYVRGASGSTGLARRYAAGVGNNSNLSFDLPHNFNTTDVNVQVYVTATGINFTPSSIQRLDANTVRVTFASAPTSDQYRVIIIG